MRKHVWAFALALGVAAAAGSTVAEDRSDAERLAHSVDELRNAVGRWSVTTTFLNPDGSVAREIPGTYVFEWIVEDRVVVGHNDLPELGQKSGILFYVREKDLEIEMVAVGADGKLWIMTGPAGGDTRYSQPYESADGKPSQLRFTRFNVTPNRFESRMEYTTDDGETWTQGNHQVFTREKG